jgi:hypothetical protein
VAGEGLGPDLEVDGCTMFRGLPTPYAVEVDAFRAACEEHALRPTVFGVYVDKARRRDRWLTVGESVRDLERQLHAAYDLGFGLVRGAVGIDLEVIERAFPKHVVSPHARCLAVLADDGYAGSVSSEWGGSEWHGLEVDALDLVGRHLEALRTMRLAGAGNHSA